jgi:hypothetical protein
MAGSQGIVTHLSAVSAFEGLLATRTIHHGANAGDDSFRAVVTHNVIGGMTAPPAAIAELAAARSGRAVPYASPIETMEAILMRDGTGVAVPVLAYADPDAQTVHRAIFNGSIEQAAARARQVERTEANPVLINIFANVAPSMPIDKIVRWRDIRPDRLCDMLVRGRVYENSTHMHAFYGDLFRSRRAATDAAWRFGDIRARTKDLAAMDAEPWSEITYQLPGQGQRVSRAWVRTHEVDATHDDLVARFGELVHFSVVPFTPGRKKAVREPVYEAIKPLRTTPAPRPAPWPAAGVAASHPPLRQPDG